MTPTMPSLIYVLNTAGDPVPVRASGNGISITLIDRTDAVQRYASGTCAANGDNIIVPAPGSGYQIAAFKIFLQSLTANLTTALLKWGSTEIGGGAFNTQYGWIQSDYPAPDRLCGGDNQPLILNLDGANSFRYMVCYYVEAV